MHEKVSQSQWEHEYAEVVRRLESTDTDDEELLTLSRRLIYLQDNVPWAAGFEREVSLLKVVITGGRLMTFVDEHRLERMNEARLLELLTVLDGIREGIRSRLG